MAHLHQYYLCLYSKIIALIFSSNDLSMVCLLGNECNELQAREELSKAMSSENDRSEIQTPIPWFQGQYPSSRELLPLPASSFVALHLVSLAFFPFNSSIVFPPNGHSSSYFDFRLSPVPLVFISLLSPSAFLISMFFLQSHIVPHAWTISLHGELFITSLALHLLQRKAYEL